MNDQWKIGDICYVHYPYCKNRLPSEFKIIKFLEETNSAQVQRVNTEHKEWVNVNWLEKAEG